MLVVTEKESNSKSGNRRRSHYSISSADQPVVSAGSGSFFRAHISGFPYLPFRHRSVRMIAVIA